MDTQQLRQLEQSLIDEFFAALNQPAPATPPQLPAPQDAEPPRPYYRGPSPEKVGRERIEAQLRQLVEMSTARLYEMLVQRLDEIKAQPKAEIEAERQRGDVERQRWLLEIERMARDNPQHTAVEFSPCTPSRQSLITSRQDFYS